MSFNYGFYNSRNGDRKYDALDISRIFDGIIKDGVFMNVENQFKVAVLSNMQLTVDSGRAWFNHTWSYNDSKFVVTITDSDVILPRIDAVILEIDEDNRMNTVKVLTGIAATVPAKPTLTNTTTVHQYPLAYITIPANSSSVTAGNIENTVGTSACPFVTGVLQGMNIDNLITQWDAQFMTWFDKMKGQLNEDAAGNLQVQIDDLQVQIDDLQVQIDDSQVQIDDSQVQIKDLKVQIGNSQVRIDDLKVQIDGFSDEIVNIFGETVATDANTATGLVFVVDANTLNTPYKVGETNQSNGIIFNANRDNNNTFYNINTQVAMMRGDSSLWIRHRIQNTWYAWVKIVTRTNTTAYQMGAMPLSGGDFTGAISVPNVNKEGYFVRNIWCGDAHEREVNTSYIWTKRK